MTRAGGSVAVVPCPAEPVPSSPDAPRTAAVLDRFRTAIACLLLTALAFSQSPGQLVADTKLDLVVAPLRFLGRALHLWEPEGAFGQLQNQAYGYLFPMGPFFAVGSLAQLPGWVVQRLWLSLVLCVALLGARRLARELGIGTPGTRLLAGFLYALSPRVLTVGGGISIEAWPLALLPWVLVPLVQGARAGSERRAAARSGVAVLCIGGVNAAATLAVLPLAGLFLLSRLATPRGRRLAAWWAAAVALACLWWALPLVQLGRYSLPFLDLIESAGTTTGRTSLVEVLRGTSHWLGYVAVPVQGAWWPAGWQLVTSSALVLATAVIAALGLVGLVRRDLPERVVLLGGLLLGTVLVTAGHVGALPGWLSPPLAEPLRDLLDGPLAPFRNVHKFDAVLRLPLVLGAAHLATVVRLPAVRVPRALRRPDLAPAGRVLAARPLAVVAALALLVTVTPLLQGRLAPGGAYDALPGHWAAVARYLERHGAGDRALVVPGAPFGDYLWGRPLDEPLQPLARSPWAVRNAVPLGSVGGTRLLDGVEERLAAGQGAPGVADALARAGVGHVVVRNDLHWVRSGSPRPVLVAQALRDSGLPRVAAFGPDLSVDVDDSPLVVDDGLALERPAVEVYAVPGADGPLATYPADALARLSGGPESLLALGARGLLAPGGPDGTGRGALHGRPVVLAGDHGSGAATAAVITDGGRRRDVDPGRVHGRASETLTAQAPRGLDRPDADLAVVPGLEHRTTVRYDGARAVSASSSAAEVGGIAPAAPRRQPWSAFDGDEETWWLSAPGASTGEWVELALDEPVRVERVEVAPLVSPALVGPRITRVRVTTDAGSLEHLLPGGDGATSLEAVPGSTTRVRVTVVGVDGAPGGQVGLREVTVPGVDVRRTVQAPPDAATGPDGPWVAAFERAVGERPACVRPYAAGAARLLCSPALARLGEEGGPLVRSFSAPAAATVELSATAVPVPGEALDAVLARARAAAGARVQVRATSSRGPDGGGETALADPAAQPHVLLDGRLGTSWVAGPDLGTLELSWDEPRPVDRLRLVSDPALAASRPLSVAVTALVGGVPVEVSPATGNRLQVSDDGWVAFDAVEATGLSLSFQAVGIRRDSPLPALARDLSTGRDRVLPVGLSELRVPALADLLATPAPDAPVRLASCDDPRGPRVEVDGRAVRMSATTTHDRLLALQPVELRPCGPPVPLAAGDHDVVSPSTPLLQTDAVVLRDTRLAPPDLSGRRTVARVVDDGATTRRVAVTAGEATFLAVRENANPGWRATLDGAPLTGVRLDGWQQGWLLPAGEAGTVELVYGPDRLFRAGLVAGALAAALLVALALVPARRPARRGPAPAARAGPATALLAVAALVLLGGPAGLAAAAVAVAAARLAGGRGRALLAGAGVLAAGALVAASPWSTPDPALDDPLPQLCALLALAAAAAALWPDRRAGAVSRGRPGAGRPAPAAGAPAPPS